MDIQSSKCQDGFKLVVLSPQSNQKYPLKYTVIKERQKKEKKEKGFQRTSSLTPPRTVWSPPLLVKQEVRSPDGKSISKSRWIEFLIHQCHGTQSVSSPGGWGPEALQLPWPTVHDQAKLTPSPGSTQYPTVKQAWGPAGSPRTDLSQGLGSSILKLFCHYIIKYLC